MSDERPEALLKSALEKIVYFEARSEQLGNDLASAKADAARLQQELGQAAQREIELRRHVASLEVELQRSHREREELGRVNDALRSERAALMEKIIEASRIHASDALEEQPFDLASFIAQLRSEVVGQKSVAQEPVVAVAAVRAVASAPAPRGPAPVAAHAERLMSEGRLQVSGEELSRLSGATSFPGRSEETLFGFSVRELSAPDAPARIRAAERLKALGQTAAAPALATALHNEREPDVQVALLAAFSEVASKEGAAIVLPLLDAASAEVRICALKALLKMDATQAGPHLSMAMKDPDRAVRRRASLLALGLSGEAALALGEDAVRDAEAEVRSLGALVLGASGGERARELLLGAMRDSDRKVRKAASQSLSRIVGEDVSNVVDLDDAQRRREIRRLSTLPVNPVRATARDVSTQATSVQDESSRGPSTSLGANGLEPLCAQLQTELRTAIRGRSLPELCTLTQLPSAHVEEACQLLVARGHAVRRGQKYFAA